MPLGNLAYFLEQTKPKLLFIDKKFAMEAVMSMCKLNILQEFFSRPNVVVYGASQSFMNLDHILHINDPLSMNPILFDLEDMKKTAIKLFTPGITASPK